ncbi:MAG: hypothetical protein KGP28_11575 [Bdellovibrionales bacterium]|nr:hypothetical protein [Bdellovibrionales bacterium]
MTGSGGFSDVVSLSPRSGELFVITHADRVWDKGEHSKRGIQSAIRQLKERMPIVLLSEPPDPKMHFLYRHIHFLLPSEAGEIQHESRVEVRVNGEPVLIREPAAPTDRILRIDFSPSDSL